jgi:hypothetical protein
MEIQHAKVQNAIGSMINLTRKLYYIQPPHFAQLLPSPMRN